MKKISNSRTSTPVKSDKGKSDSKKKFFAIKNKIAKLKKQLATEESKLPKASKTQAPKRVKRTASKSRKPVASRKAKISSVKTPKPTSVHNYTSKDIPILEDAHKRWNDTLNQDKKNLELAKKKGDAQDIEYHRKELAWSTERLKDVLNSLTLARKNSSKPLASKSKKRRTHKKSISASELKQSNDVVAAKLEMFENSNPHLFKSKPVVSKKRKTTRKTVKNGKK